MLEAVCRECGETFIPADEADTIHGECDAQGDIIGEWIFTPPETASARTDWLTPGEAADMLGVSTRTLARMKVGSMRLPSGHRRYARVDIDRLKGAPAP